MGENSLREQIILADVAILEAMSQIKTVKRTVQSYADLQEFATPQFPAVAVVGGLPVPTNHVQTRTGQVDQIVSLLKVNVYTYLMANKDHDSVISSMLDDMWPALYADPTRNGLCMFTELTATGDKEQWDPYVAFLVTINHQYKHNTQGV